MQLTVTQPPLASPIETVASPSDAFPAAANQTEFLGGFCALRFLSAACVVVFHCAEPGLSIGRFCGLLGVAVFVALAGALQGMRTGQDRFAVFASRRAKRILVPWVVWSAIYGLVALGRYLRSGTIPNWDWNWLFIGTEVHLWFFPFIFVIGIAGWWLMDGARHWSLNLRVAALALSAGILTLALPFLALYLNPPTPYGQMLACAPLMFIGLALGLADMTVSFSARWKAIGFANLPTATAGIIGWWISDDPTFFVYPGGVALVSLALLIPFRVNSPLRFASDLSMGIYVSHPFVLLVVRWMFRNGPGSLAATSCFVLTGAILFAIALRRASFARGVA